MESIKATAEARAPNSQSQPKQTSICFTLRLKLQTPFQAYMVIGVQIVVQIIFTLHETFSLRTVCRIAVFIHLLFLQFDSSKTSSIIIMCDNDSQLTPPSSNSSLALRQVRSSSGLLVTPEATAFSFASSPMSLSTQVSPAALVEYQQRLQLYAYAAQAVRFGLSHAGPAGYALGGLNGHPALSDSVGPGSLASLSPFSRYDPRSRFMHEEPKPQHSYIGLIAMAILSVPDKKMVLSDIYQHILDHYPYFRNRGPGWRNSIRHNLSLNDCFVKAGRSANGKGHYWAIHPANVEDFKKGDFRRRKAQRKVRKHMGLSVPEDEDSQSPTPTPLPRPGSHYDHFNPSNNPPMAMHVPLHGPQLCTNLASLQGICLPLASYKNSMHHKSGDLHKSVPEEEEEDEDSQSPTPSPLPRPGSHYDRFSPSNNPPMATHVPLHGPQLCTNLASLQEMFLPLASYRNSLHHKSSDINKSHPLNSAARSLVSTSNLGTGRPVAMKRQFDVESLLAPDCDSTVCDRAGHSNHENHG